MSEWQPIKTAPKDWSLIILYSPEYQEPCVDDMGEWHEERVYAGYYSNGEYGGSNQWFEGRNVVSVDPTHWMPLPPPPQQGGE